MAEYIVIECDNDCGATSDGGAPDKPTARRWAKRDGWVRVTDSHGIVDLCPACKAQDPLASSRG